MSEPKRIWSEYQKKIFYNIAKDNEHLLVVARAGSAKSSTIVEGAKFVPRGKTSLFCAFNKSIQEELKLKLPSYASSSTIHSLGWRALKNRFKNIELNDNKCWEIVEAFFSNPKENYDLIENICNAVKFCKATITDTPDKIEGLIEEYDIDLCGEELSVFINYVCQALRKCKEDTKQADFNDMVWLPFVYGLDPGKYDYVFIDECFPYDQCVVTDTGKMKIGSIYNKFSKGLSLPLVKSYNESSGKFEFSKITNAWDRGLKDLVEIKCGKRKIKCTENHKFLTDKGWVEAGKLYSGALIKTSEPQVRNHQVIGHIQHALNDDQLQIVLGSFLGDGSIKKISDNRYRLEVIHGEKQKEYCEWKASIFNTSVNFVEKNGFAQKAAYRFKTKSFSIPNSVFLSKKISCPQWVLDNLDERGLAIWFMDDGSIDGWGKSARLWTSSFDEDSQNRIVNKLLSFGISSKVKSYFNKKRNKNYSHIVIGADGFSCLVKKIAPYVHENILYKINYFNTKEKYKWNNIYKPYGFCAVDSVTKLNIQEIVYDIEVEKNHNFIVCSGLPSKCYAGLIAHNCQDLTTSQIELALSAVKPDGRIIAVLDNFQAIYGFTGADCFMLDKLRERLKPKELSLPICYRCPTKVIKIAQQYVPDILPYENAIEGEINYVDVSELQNLAKPGDYVLSRLNAPLIKHCLKFLKAGIPANILGRDVGDGLLYMIKKSKKKKVDAFLKWLYDWAKNEKERILYKYPKASTEVISDKVECMENLCDGASSLEEVKKNIQDLFKNNDEKNIVLFSSIHRAKGKQSNNVFVLTNTLRSSSQQEINIKYIAFTRAMKKLYMVTEKTKYDTWEDANKPSE